MTDLNSLALPDLYREFRASGLLARALDLARDEDLGPDWETSGGDPTSRALTTPAQTTSTLLVARNPGIVAGLAAIDDILFAFRADADFTPFLRDGDPVQPGTILGRLEGNARGMLAAERTILNLVSRLSGIATRTATFVAAVHGTRAKILDTRKTTPGLRLFEKYAVRCGGGSLHRVGLFDAALFKDNHLASIAPADLPASVGAAARRAQDSAGRDGLRFVEVEVDSLEQLRALLAAGGCGCSIILLDNMTPDLLRQAVALRDQHARNILLEASGGITLDTVRAVAEAGVDRISLGTLTHGATSLDIGLDTPSDEAR